MSFTLSNFHYYLSLLFYKYISKYESHILKGINLISFENINSKNIEAVFSRFDKSVENQFYKGIFNHLDFLISENELKEISNQINELNLISKNDFQNEFEEALKRVSLDFSRNYSYNFSNSEINNLIFSIIKSEQDQFQRIYDPALGYGGFLLKSDQELKVKEFYGDELNLACANVSKMRMIINGVNEERVNIRNVDSIIDIEYESGKFDLIVSEPPFLQKAKLSDEVYDIKAFSLFQDEFKSVLSEYSFILKSLNLLSLNGIMVVFLPSSILFKESGKNMREALIEKGNFLDVVISIPEKVLTHTHIETSIMIFRKNRKANDPIFFMNIENFFSKVSRYNSISDEAISEVVEIFSNRKNIDKISRTVDPKEIKENDFNLNISRYIQSFEVRARKTTIDLIAENEKLTQELEELNIKMKQLLTK